MHEKNFSIAVHPGAVLQDILDESDLTQYELARHLGMPHSKINEICRGKRGVSAKMATMLGRAFGQSPEFWLNLQKSWELRA
jgi:antitoxin HigA-1